MTHRTGRVAVVTGGASGIGLAFAEAYADQGLHIALVDVDSAALSHAVDTLRSRGADVVGHIADLRDAEAVIDVADKAANRGQIAAVCLNAGVTSTGHLLWETPSEVFDFVMGVNIRGLFNSVRAFVPRLIDQQTISELVVTASMAGMTTSAYSAAYSASKAGAIALTKALRAELEMTAPHVRVVLLNPGMVKTNLMRTSSTHLPIALAADVVEAGHEALNQIGVAPAEAVSWALKALDEGRFWALPPREDVFSVALQAELAEMLDATR